MIVCQQLKTQMINARFAVLLILAFFFTGCLNVPSRFYWGEYEQLIYQMYAEPGQAPPALQISKLEAGIEKARSMGKIVGPGIYAHLGMMYLLEGDLPLAKQAFESELAAFPESQVLIQGMLEKMPTQTIDKKIQVVR